MSSLLQDVLRTQSQNASVPPDTLAAKLNNISLDDEPSSVQPPATITLTDENDESDRAPSPSSEEEELIGVQSAVGTPRTGSRTGSRSHSPTRGAASRRAPGPLLLSSGRPAEPSRDPLKALPTDLSQRIFGYLAIKQLARCARVSKKWNRSQTLNYVWFQHYRMESFHDESLPPGKWTRRESKQNWRVTYLDMRKKEEKEDAGVSRGGGIFPRSGTASRGGSGYQTPREIREEAWKQVSEETKPGKVEMRELYKELGGRKPKTKGKYQAGSLSKDRGGWTAGEE